MAYRTGGKLKQPQTMSGVLGEKEKIEFCMEVTKGKERNRDKKYYLVISHLKGSDMNYNLTLLTQNKDVIRVKTQHSFLQLQVVDFLAEDDSRSDFELGFREDHRLHLVAENWEEKKKFLVQVYRIAKSALPREMLPQFLNVNTQMLAETIYLNASLKGLEDSRRISGTGPMVDSLEHEYKYLTIEEANDIEAITGDCEWETMSAEAYINKLTMELSGLDKANIHSIMNVEQEVMRLFEKMDDAMKQLDLLEEKLNNYSNILTSEESKILDISLESGAQSLRAVNNQKLLKASEHLLNLLTLEHSFDSFDSLNKANLDQFTAAVEEAQQKRDILRGHELEGLRCVQDLLKACNRFLGSVPRLLNEEMRELLRWDWQSKHRARHFNVSRYTVLLNWCRHHHLATWNSIYEDYQASVAICYEKEFSTYFKDKVIAVQKKTTSEKGFSFAGKSAAQSVIDITASQRNLHGSFGSIDSVNKGSAESMAHLQQQNEQFSKFDVLFCQVLDFIVPLMSDEEEHLHTVFGVPYMAELPQDVSDAEREEIKQQNERTNMILLEMFGDKLQKELRNLIDVSCKVDNYFALFMYLRLSKSCYNKENSVFLTRFLSSLLIIVKRHFENFINNQVIQISEMKASKGKRCGILTCVHRLVLFMKDTERIFDGRERRTEIEKGYINLLQAIFDAINRVAKEQQKVPVEVVMFENYHHIAQLLGSLRVEALTKVQVQAQKLYDSNLREYVTVKLGNPIEKISEFFEGVKKALETTAKPEEVGFQIKYSRNTLKGLIKQYNLKDVKKSIEHVIVKMEKHLSEEEKLFPVVSQAYCKNITSQITEYHALIRKCYPDSGLTFEFKAQDISRIFDEKIMAAPSKHHLHHRRQSNVG